MKRLIALTAVALTVASCRTDEQLASKPAAPASAPEPAVMPAPQPVAAQTSSGTTHTVAKGDTLGTIAKERGVSATDLARWNNIRDPRRLRIGQELRLTAP